MERPLTNEERYFITRIAEKLGVGERDQLLADLKNATAKPDGTDWVIFEIAGYLRPPNCGRRPYLVEGRLLDSDGEKVDVVLHADENGRLFELEFIRYADGPFVAPNWTTLEFLYE